MRDEVNGPNYHPVARPARGPFVAAALIGILAVSLSLPSHTDVSWSIVSPARYHAALDDTHESCSPFRSDQLSERIGVTDPRCGRTVDLSSNHAEVHIKLDWFTLETKLKSRSRGENHRQGGTQIHVKLLNGSPPSNLVRKEEPLFPPDKPPRGLKLNFTGLEHDQDYSVQIAVQFGEKSWNTFTDCVVDFRTGAKHGNLVSNPGFEQSSRSAHYHATRFAKTGGLARLWTPFYTGGYSLACGIGDRNRTRDGQDLVGPRSGNCSLLLGRERTLSAWAPKGVSYFGAHQAITIPAQLGDYKSGFVVSWWFFTIGVSGPPAESFSVQVGLQYSEGESLDPGIVPQEFGDVNAWERSCVKVDGSSHRDIRMIHVYFHFHQRPGMVLIDDVDVRPVSHEDEVRGCHVLGDKRSEEERRVVQEPTTIHLKSSESRSKGQLTLTVPMTADRVSRLEMLSRSYGGGPVAAAVLVQDKSDIDFFTDFWKESPWLYKHVDVQFVHDPESMKKGLFPINVLRNVAVRLVDTEFVLMLDVDLMPGKDAFACLRARDGAFLRSILPVGSRRAFIVPVFITEVSHRAPRSKAELQNALLHRRALPYCINSQMGTKFERWYSAETPFEVKFETDYEPYAILRRDGYPSYDERFVGYGFNKVSWVVGAVASGFRLFLLPEQFLVHLNHAENDWVQHIDVGHYLQTWRRYFAFAAEVAGEGPTARYTPAPLSAEAEAQRSAPWGRSRE